MGATAKAALSCNRRGFIGRVAAAPAIVAATSGVATAAGFGPAIKVYKGRYAIDGHRIVDGFFASPRGKARMDMVVVIPATGTLDAAAETMARSYAADGYMAIVPNLPTSYRAASIGGKPAMVAALMRDMPRIRAMAQSSGKVAVVAA